MWISWLYNLQKVHNFMKNTTHLLFWEIMGFIHRSFYQDISFQLQCISTRQVCSSVFMWTILEYWFSSFLICFKAVPIKILQRGFLIRKHFNSTCIPGANSTFFRKRKGLSHTHTDRQSYVVWSIIINSFLIFS